MEQNYTYYAFISYKREDESWAKWLQEKLEYFKLPASLNGSEDNDTPHYIRPVFRDITDLRPGILSERIKEALDQSKYLIALCSPRYSKSTWCDAEIKRFIETNKAANIIPFIIDGTPYANDDSECFPPSLRLLRGSKNELLGADIRPISSEYAFIQVVASMLDINTDILWKRYLRNEEQEKARIKAENDRLLTLQSRIVAEKAEKSINEWPYDTQKAVALASNVLPTNFQYPERPWVIEAEYVLRKCLTEETTIADFTDLDCGGIVCYNQDIVIFNGVRGPIDNENPYPPESFTLRVYNVHNKNLLCTIDGTYAILSNNGLCLITKNKNSIELWNTKNWKIINSIKNQNQQKQSICISNDDKLLSIQSKTHIEFVTLPSLETISSISIDEIQTEIRSTQFSPSNSLFMVSLQDGTIYIWDVATSKLIKTIEYNGILTCSKFINNSTILSAITTKNKNSSKDHHSIMRYDLKSSNNLQPISLNGSLWSVSDIYYQEGSKNIIVEDISNKIYIYDIDSGRKIFDSSGSRKLRILNEGKMIVCRDGIKIIQFRIPSREEIIEIAKSKMNGYVLSEDDKEEYYLK